MTQFKIDMEFHEGNCGQSFTATSLVEAYLKFLDWAAQNDVKLDWYFVSRVYQNEKVIWDLYSDEEKNPFIALKRWI